MAQAAAAAATIAAGPTTFTGCARFDLGEPIELVPAATWSPGDVATLTAAAECWQLEFGVPFHVVREPTATQVVVVDYNPFTCWISFGRFTPAQVAQIDICPIERWRNGSEWPRQRLLLVVLLHELGHAAGIRTEGKLGASVMGSGFTALHAKDRPLFSHEDARLLAEAAPGAGGSSACEATIEGTEPDVRCVCR